MRRSRIQRVSVESWGGVVVRMSQSSVMGRCGGRRNASKPQDRNHRRPLVTRGLVNIIHAPDCSCTSTTYWLDWC